jgi:hypothetical protein
LGVIPEIGRLGYFFFFLDLCQLPVNVKDASSTLARAPPVPSSVLW